MTIGTEMTNQQPQPKGTRYASEKKYFLFRGKPQGIKPSMRD